MNDDVTDSKPPVAKLNLWEFSRMYKVYNIPITDFIIVYIVLYFLSRLYSWGDPKMIFLLTIPITLIFNMIINPKLTVGIYNVLFIIVIIFVIYASSQ